MNNFYYLNLIRIHEVFFLYLTYDEDAYKIVNTYTFFGNYVTDDT